MTLNNCNVYLSLYSPLLHVQAEVGGKWGNLPLTFPQVTIGDLSLYINSLICNTFFYLKQSYFSGTLNLAILCRQRFSVFLF